MAQQTLNELYEIIKMCIRDSSSDASVVIRPDLTMPIGRFLATTNIELPRTFYYLGDVFMKNKKHRGDVNLSLIHISKAREDLLEIKSFIEEETGDIELAKKTVSDIVTTNDSLSIFPEMGQRLLIDLGSKIEYRYLLCHNYLSFYRYLDRTIYIDRILNSRRDYLRILLDEVH